MAVVAPIPSVRTRRATAVKTGVDRSERRANVKSASMRYWTTGTPLPLAGLLVALPVLDDQVYALQQIDVPKHVAADGDDVGKLAGRNRPDVFVFLHHDRRPVRGGANGFDRRHTHLAHPDIQLIPRRLTVKLHRDAA